jgi:hypothetical protein
MVNGKKKLAGLSVLVFGVGLALSIPASAGAASLGFEFGIGSGKGHVLLGSPHYRHHGFRHHGGRRFNTCSPGEAIHKARRMGLRHARIDRIGHRFVMVDGRRHGSHLEVAFIKRSRNCSVARVQRERRGHHGYGSGRYGRGKRH